MTLAISIAIGVVVGVVTYRTGIRIMRAVDHRRAVKRRLAEIAKGR